jgi:hypothetical protein
MREMKATQMENCKITMKLSCACREMNVLCKTRSTMLLGRIFDAGVLLESQVLIEK